MSPDPAVAPRLPRHLHAERPAADLFLFSESGVRRIPEEPYGRVAALVDGRRGADRIADELGTDTGDVTAALRGLAGAGLVTTAPAAPDVDADPAALAYWDATAGTGRGAGRPDPGTDRATVAVLPVTDRCGTDAVVRALGTVPGTDVRTAGPGPAPPDGTTLSVVLCRDHLDPRLADVDAAHRAAGVPWLLARVTGVTVWIGPVFTGDGGPCWHCLGDRLWGHRRAEAAVQSALGADGPVERPVAALPAGTDAAAGVVALQVEQHRRGLVPELAGAVWTLDTRTLAARRHELTRRPQCAVCGDPALVAAAAERPPELDGDGAAPDPAGFVRRHAHLVSPVTGVVTDLVAEPARYPGRHVVRAGATVTRRVDDLARLGESLRMVNGGSGASEEQARAGALGEAVERHCGEHHGDERRVRGSLRSLGDVAVDPSSVMLVDARQRADRHGRNRERSSFTRIGPPVDPDDVLDWTPLWSLADGSRRLLPIAMLYYGAPGPEWASADSSGCAAGPTLRDAVRRGLQELVERDAVALWWYNRSPLQGIRLEDLAAAGADDVAAALDRHRAWGRRLEVLDATSDLGVPVMVAVSTRHRDGPERGDRIMVGFGADVRPVAAVRRALCELEQMMPAVLDDDVRTDDPDLRRWLGEATAANQPWTRAVRQVPLPAGPAARGPAGDPPDPPDPLGVVVDRLLRAGLDPLVLDQTRPDVDVPVVRTVVPGLRPMWPRFAPGRLYDVPVRLGRRARPVRYDELNPLPLFL